MNAVRSMDAQTRIATLPTAARSRKRTPRIVACHGCGVEGPATLMLRSPDGPMCDRCAIKADQAVRARREAWKNLRTAMLLLTGTIFAATAAVLASGRIPFIGVDPTATILAFAAAAGLGALSFVWGAWAAVTGGDRRLRPGGAWRAAVRIGGGVAATFGLGTGVVVLTLAVLGIVA